MMTKLFRDKKEPLYGRQTEFLKIEPFTPAVLKEILADYNPEYSKDMVHVYDCAQMLCKAVTVNRDNGWYNVGTGVPVTLREQIETIIKVFSPKDHPSQIIFRPEKPVGGGFLMDITNAKEELGYEPQYDCQRLFEDYKNEMKINRFLELRNNE